MSRWTCRHTCQSTPTGKARSRPSIHTPLGQSRELSLEYAPRTNHTVCQRTDKTRLQRQLPPGNVPADGNSLMQAAAVTCGPCERVPRLPCAPQHFSKCLYVYTGTIRVITKQRAPSLRVKLNLTNAEKCRHVGLCGFAASICTGNLWKGNTEKSLTRKSGSAAHFVVRHRAPTCRVAPHELPFVPEHHRVCSLSNTCQYRRKAYSDGIASV